MRVNVLDIGGPCEPGVYAVARVELSTDDQNSLTIDKLLVVRCKERGLCVYIPHPAEDDAYGDQPTYVLSPTLRRVVARAVLDAYSSLASEPDYYEPQYAQACELSEWCGPSDEC